MFAPQAGGFSCQRITIASHLEYDVRGVERPLCAHSVTDANNLRYIRIHGTSVPPRRRFDSLEPAAPHSCR